MMCLTPTSPRSTPQTPASSAQVLAPVAPLFATRLAPAALAPGLAPVLAPIICITPALALVPALAPGSGGRWLRNALRGALYIPHKDPGNIQHRVSGAYAMHCA